MKRPFLRRSRPRRSRPRELQLCKADRGIAHQIDFMTSMVIRVVAFSLLLAASTALIHAAIDQDYSNVIVGQRGASRLVDDLLVTTPGDALVNATCTIAFFEQSPTACGFPDEWASHPQYLNVALGISSDRHLNVTIRNTTGELAVLDNTRLTLGDRPPQISGTVYRWHRQIGIIPPGSDTVSWYTVTVSVWE